MFSYKIDRAFQTISIQFQGDLDIEVSEIMEEEIIPALESCIDVEFDFKGVPFVDSTGIGIFINLIEILKKKDAEIKIRNIQPLVREVFEMLQLKEIMGEKVKLVG
ncbi:STAS domain-containing protein [Robertmurraya massiliosenegalensis]|uniref:STAS domain-containing protein n=1 Tax=Robertmurraya TaxID=2837507 RepID=UPI0039A6F91F